MPRIWLDYCQFLVSQCKITRSRQTFDRALRALPVTQHPRIWPLYLRFVRNLPLPETAIRVYRRYLKVREHSIQTSSIQQLPFRMSLKKVSDHTVVFAHFQWQLMEMDVMQYDITVWCDWSECMNIFCKCLKILSQSQRLLDLLF